MHYGYSITIGLTSEQNNKLNNHYKQMQEESTFKVNKSEVCRDLIKKGINYYENVDLIECQINNLQTLFEKQVQLTNETRQILDELNEIYKTIKG